MTRQRQTEMFVCPECGPRVKADEDGCCTGCGLDCTVEPYEALDTSKPSPGPVYKCPTHGSGVRVFEPSSDRIYCVECGELCSVDPTAVASVVPTPTDPDITITISGGCSHGVKQVFDGLEAHFKSVGFGEVYVEAPDYFPWPWDGMTGGESVLIKGEDLK